jgi:hypothetical protein
MRKRIDAHLIAQVLLDHGCHADEGPSGRSKDISWF